MGVTYNLGGERKAPQSPKSPIASVDSGFEYKEHRVNRLELIKKWLTKKHKCVFCHIPIVPMLAKAMEFNLEIDGELTNAMDVYYRCPECGMQYVFGEPLSKEEYEEVKSMGEVVQFG